jgi:iron complex outermembrane recepter protein
VGRLFSTFGADVFDPTGRAQTANDLLAGWKVKERSASLYAQADLDGTMLGKSYRGKAGVRVVHTNQTSTGMESLNGAAPTPTEGGASDTEVLPSFNMIFNMDEMQEHQVRFSMARLK